MLFLFFLFALLLTLLSPAFAPSFNLQFFVPVLILSYYRKPLVACLWLSLCCGLILDLLASDHRLGLHALNYCLITLVLYNQKRNFFEDSLTTLPIMTLFFSVLSTGLQVILLVLFEKGLPLTIGWVATDLILLPLCDALYGFIFFTIPFSFKLLKAK